MKEPGKGNVPIFLSDKTSSKGYLDFILEQFSELDYMTYRAEDL